DELARRERPGQHGLVLDKPEYLLVSGRRRNDRLIAMPSDSPISWNSDVDFRCCQVRRITVEWKPSGGVEKVTPLGTDVSHSLVGNGSPLRRCQLTGIVKRQCHFRPGLV